MPLTWVNSSPGLGMLTSDVCVVQVSGSVMAGWTSGVIVSFVAGVSAIGFCVV